MARYGIVATKAFGVTAPSVRALARTIGTNHPLALALWTTKYLEARTLAAMIADPALVTRGMMESWVREFDNWAVCDGVCGVLFDQTPFAEAKAMAWCIRTREFTRRAGFVLMACMAVHRKELPDEVFARFLSAIEEGSGDGRNFVKKGINWALRQIGKRNMRLNLQARETAERIRLQQTPSARWIAADALRELRSPAVLARLETKERRSAIVVQKKEKQRQR